MVGSAESGNRGAFVLDADDHEARVVVFGEVDELNEDEFREAMDAAAETGCTVVVDLTRCTFIGSCGFHVVTDYRDRLEDLRVIASEPIAALMRHIDMTDVLAPPDA